MENKESKMNIFFLYKLLYSKPSHLFIQLTYNNLSILSTLSNLIKTHVFFFFWGIHS